MLTSSSVADFLDFNFANYLAQLATEYWLVSSGLSARIWIFWQESITFEHDIV